MPQPISAKIFRNGRNQAIRIPVEMSFATDTVTLEKVGNALVVRPQLKTGWKEYFADDSLRLPDDFEIPEDLPLQERESL
jgi:antitoxin VapB